MIIWIPKKTFSSFSRISLYFSNATFLTFSHTNLFCIAAISLCAYYNSTTHSFISLFLSLIFFSFFLSFLPSFLLLDLQEEASVCDQQHRSHGRWLRDEKCPRWQPSGMGECSIALIAIVMRECLTDRVIGFNLTPYDWTYSYTYTCKYVHKYTWSHPQTCAYRHTHTNARRQQLLHISNESTVSTFMTE